MSQFYKRLSNLSVRNKIIIISMLVAITSLSIISTSMAIYEYKHNKESIGGNLSLAAKLIGSRSSAALSFDDKPLAEENLSALTALPDIILACIYKTVGLQLFAEYRNNLTPPAQNNTCPAHLIQTNAKVIFTKHYSHVSMPIWAGSESNKVGYIYIRQNHSQIDNHLTLLAYVIFSLLILTTLVAYFLSKYLQGYITTPLTNLTSIAKKVDESQDYSLRVSAISSDEFGMLGRAFNSMLNTINEQNIELLNTQNTLEQKVKERTINLEYSIQELEAFSYTVSHDLKAPLRSIHGFTSMFVEDYGDTLEEEAKDLLKRIQNNSQKMGELIDDMLLLSRVSRFQISKTPLNLSEIANEIIEKLKEQNQNNTAVEVTIEENIKATCDKKLITIILDNLIGNAWKYSQKKEHPHIEFGYFIKKDKPVYFVKDNGVGFNPKYSKKLFIPFSRLHKEKDFPGNGIGLATVERVLFRCDGHIWAESEPGQGATFFFMMNDKAGQQQKLSYRLSPE